ncbi:MAG: hypothetical protein CVU24_16155 [Betaproteobacteria bacterium HGW-Betaproteobacteria-18]|uniref:type 4 pilus major pilin n=1 Tax=Hydrogenophaga aromaticivorans TaxID=2610898 RepID=UPI000CA89AD5|nr:type 4 pilus major pilin [Hydrogenophaga aromaticivorans]PKO59013.1 MAG: hypothetical protein CVU24_16155 [Betaproteobacteria bacterium HGW-Betaproteobacteria-18]
MFFFFTKEFHMKVVQKIPGPMVAHKQRGVSLPLIAIILAVSLLLAIAALIYGPRYIQQTKADNDVTAIQDLKGQVVKYGGRVGVFTAANSSLAVLVGQGLFPRSVVGGTQAAPTVTNEWGGRVTVAVGTVNTAGDSIVFTRTAVPEVGCTLVGTSLDDLAETVVIGATTTKTPGARSNAAAVNTACRAGGNNNTMVVTIAR